MLIRKTNVSIKHYPTESLCVLMSPDEKSLKTQAVALRMMGESLWLL